ncbi:esterase-like activity of phytase family protein [Maricaulis sp.]|uniref:esterase-like activity of phytase family protein n=1 Tax=Maricaulis sp. TaxID=1486257 RepID=UPI00263334A7|nr:esterase-like activity of phytase family protein [Maricaulis sp.]
MRAVAFSATVLGIALAACAGAQDYSATPVPLYPDTPGRDDLDGLRYLGGLEIAHEDDRFGGLSALEVTPDGTRILALSDSAWWVTATLDWSGTGRLSGLDDLDIQPVLGPDGDHLEGRQGDSEGLAPIRDGRHAVSFEREHRVLAYDLGPDWTQAGSVLPEVLQSPPGADALADNRGLEALATIGPNRLLAGIEYPRSVNLRHELWEAMPGSWRRLDLMLDPGFGLTGMTSHAGRLYLLTRFYSPDYGNRIIIRHMPEAVLARPGPARPERLATLGAQHSVDNFEGIAAFTRNGETILLIVSDDNYSNRQRTLLLAFAVAEN